MNGTSERPGSPAGLAGPPPPIASASQPRTKTQRDPLSGEQGFLKIHWLPPRPLAPYHGAKPLETLESIQ